MCLSFVKDPFDAEDLTQDTFLSAYKSLSRFDHKNPKSWLCTIAANKCRDHLKSAARRTAAVDGEILALVRDEAPSVEEQTERHLGDEDVDRLLDRLREPYRTTARLYYRGELTVSEIALQTGDNPKTVATRLFRAKQQLKLLIKEDPNGCHT